MPAPSASPARVARMGGKALVKVGYACNQDCTFCHASGERGLDATDAEVRAKIARAAALGHDMVVLSGGEPTLRPELLGWADEACRHSLAFGLVTNGVALADPGLVEALLAKGLGYVQQSVHGSTEEVHRQVVRAGTFDAVWAAAGNLAGRGIRQVLQFVVTRQNLWDVEAFVERGLAFPGAVVKFSMVFAKGGGETLFDAVTPRVAEAASAVGAAIARGLAEVARRGTGGPSFGHDGFPLCLLPGLESLVDDLRTNGFATMSEAGEADFFAVDEGTNVRPEEVCGPCTLRGACPGLSAGYVARRGAGELAPRTGGRRGNSFHWVFEELVAPATDGECPLRDGPLGVTPWDRGRQLFVRHGARTGRFRTATRDFDDVEVEAVKHRLGQVYLDASRKDAPDDFARDLVPLRRAALCAPCLERERCTGLFEPVFSPNLFERDDALVREVVASLRGEVLDVGCGDGPYGDLLARLARDGTIRYTGLDPDPVRLASLSARWPWARLLPCEAEDLDGALEAGAVFDHALVLRSWNHLRDPALVLRLLARLLAPGGTLTLADNVAFGVARTRAQAERAERSPAELEHARNDGAGEAVRLLCAAGFAVLERRDVAPQASNQWLLLCRSGGLPAANRSEG